MFKFFSEKIDDRKMIYCQKYELASLPTTHVHKIVIMRTRTQ